VALLAALVLAAVAVVTWGLLVKPDGEASDRQQAALPANALVWVASSQQEGDGIVTGAPDGPEHFLVPFSKQQLAYPAISPDRRTVAYLKSSGSGGGDLYTVRSDGSGRHRLEPSADCRYGGRPSWSPDGDQLATICYAQDGSPLGVAVAALNGTARILTKDPTASTPAWSPAGDVVVYSKASKATDGSVESTLWEVPADGGQPTQLTQGKNGTRDLYPAVDPTGQWVAFTRVTGDAGALVKLELRSPDHKETPLTSPTHGVDKDPAWSPDGTIIAFQQGQSIDQVPADGGHRAKRLFGSGGTTLRHMVAWQ